jgi:hypothetical protein
MRDDGANRPVRMTSGINALLGLWIVISPWAVGAPSPAVARSATAAGLVIAVCSAIRFMSRGTAALSWANVVLGGWVVLSPWVYGGYTTGDIRTWNYFVAGALIAGLEGLSLTFSALRHPWSPSSHVDSGSSDKAGKPR